MWAYCCCPLLLPLPTAAAVAPLLAVLLLAGAWSGWAAWVGWHPFQGGCAGVELWGPLRAFTASETWLRFAHSTAL